MKNTDKSLVSASSEINEIFLQLEKNVAAPVLDVPTPLESSRPSANADKLHYRHQPVINPHVDDAYISPREFAARQAARLLSENCLIVDTETTGLGEDAEIVEISVINTQGKLVWGSLIKPTRPIPPDATAIHGITDEMVFDAPDFHEIYVEFASLFNARVPVVFYNADYDLRLIYQTSVLWCLDAPLSLLLSNPVCAMRLYAQFDGRWDEKRNDYKWHKLVDAAAVAGVSPAGAHRAYADCVMTLGVLRHMAKFAEQSK